MLTIWFYGPAKVWSGWYLGLLNNTRYFNSTISWVNKQSNYKNIPKKLYYLQFTSTLLYWPFMRNEILYFLVALLTILVGFCSLALSSLNHCLEQQGLENRLDSWPSSSTTMCMYYSEPATESTMPENISELTTVTDVTTHVSSSQIPRWLEKIRSEGEAYNKSYTMHGFLLSSYAYKVKMYFDYAESTLKDLLPRVLPSKTFQKPLIESLVSSRVLDNSIKHVKMLHNIIATLKIRKYHRHSHYKTNYCPILRKQTHELFENANVDSYKQLKRGLAFGEKQQETMMLVDAAYFLVFTLTNLCVNEYQAKLIVEEDLKDIATQIDVSSNDIGQILENGRYMEKAGRITLLVRPRMLRKRK